MKKETFLTLIFVLFIFSINYSYLDNLLIKTFEEGESGIINRVVDGDTLIVNNKTVRLLGINSPEKGEVGYKEAKIFLEQFNGSKIYLEYGKNKYDKYNRELAYVFYNGRNLNLESVKKGYSNIYFPEGKEKYYKIFSNAWGDCLTENINLCEKREESCLKFLWKPKEDYLEIRNLCSYDFLLKGFSIKDEGRKKIIFNDEKILAKEKMIITSENFKETYVWTNSGDSIFVRNENNKLIYFESY